MGADLETMTHRQDFNENQLESWGYQADIILLMSLIHDEEYRQTHKKPKDAITYPDGRWTCKDMVQSRLNSKKIKKIITEALMDSPFLSACKEAFPDLLKAIRTFDERSY